MNSKGDKKSRASGANDPGKGLSERSKITETPDQLGMGRNEANGKPKGPQKTTSGGQRFA